MALPEAQAEPVVEEGVCYALFAYDAGLAINLDESERRITALTQRAAIRHKRRAPRYFEYRPAPLRVTQEREPLAVGAFRTTPSVEAVLYDFGAVSVTYQAPLAGPLVHLTPRAEERERTRERDLVGDRHRAEVVEHGLDGGCGAEGANGERLAFLGHAQRSRRSEEHTSEL